MGRPSQYPLLLFAWALLAGASVLAKDSIAQAQWHTLTGSEKSFTVELPGEPEHTASELRTGAGAPYTMHQYVFEQGELAYVVQTAIYPDEVDLANPRANLQGGLDNAAKSMEGGRWASIDWATQQGHVAVGAVGECKGRAVRSFSVLAGRRIVALTYAGPPGSARTPDVDRFIGSLRLDSSP
jgi:hypothetical protein